MPTLTELTGKPHLSYSSLHTYLECGEKWRLQKIVRAPEAPAYWFPGGTAVHTGTEVYDLSRSVDELGHTESLENAIKAFHNKFTEELDKYTEANPGAEWRAGGRRTKANPNGEDAAWWRLDGPRQVAEYAAWRVQNPWYTLAEIDGLLGVEFPFTSEFADLGLPTQGYIDRIFDDQRTGEQIVVDLKSGSRIPADISQLAIYATAVEEQHGRRPRWGAYFMTRTATLTPTLDLSRWNADMLGKWFRNAKTAIELEHFTPRLSSDCGYCSVRDFCYAQNPDIELPY